MFVLQVYGFNEEVVLSIRGAITSFQRAVLARISFRNVKIRRDFKAPLRLLTYLRRDAQLKRHYHFCNYYHDSLVPR